MFLCRNTVTSMRGRKTNWTAFELPTVKKKSCIRVLIFQITDRKMIVKCIIEMYGSQSTTLLLRDRRAELLQILLGLTREWERNAYWCLTICGGNGMRRSCHWLMWSLLDWPEDQSSIWKVAFPKIVTRDCHKNEYRDPRLHFIEIVRASNIGWESFQFRCFGNNSASQQQV